MEDMNFDQVIDIPDTPERAGARHKNGVQFGKDSTRSLAGLPRKSNLMNEQSLNPPKASLSAVPSENGHSRRLHSHPHKSVIDVDDFDLRRSTPLENSHHCKRSPLFRRAAIVNNSKPENKNSKGGQHMENRKSVCAPIPFKKPVCLEDDDDDVLDLTKQSVQDRLFDLAFSHEAPKGFSAKETREGQITSNGHSSLHLAPSTSRKSGDTFKGKEKVDVNTCNGSGSTLMNGNKIDPFGGTQNKIDKQLPASHLSATSPRVFGRKRLVRNGCISPNNISSRAQKLAESLLCGSTDDGKNHTRVMDSDGLSEADLREIVSEGNDCYTAKRKRAIIHPSTSKVHDSSNNDVLNSSSVTNNEASGQRKRTANEQSHLQNLITKRKRTHGLENQGECSKVIPDEPEILVLGSSRDASSSRSSRVNNRQHEAILEPIYEIGDFSLETRNNNCQGIGSRSNEDPDPRSRQLEADEMLARELQEQLYHEEPIFGLGEIDENIAWVLQQDEEAFSAQSSENHPVAHLRNLPMLRHHPTRSSHNPSNRRGAQVRVSTTRRSELRNRFSNRPPVTISRARHRSSTALRRGLNFQFPSGMDLDMRLDILENLEASITTASHMFQVQRDFNENDYEMLLALDERNPQHGASARQINSLPESMVQTDNPEETCAICLESPAIGEKIRHLPCLHKFHKDCIDPWLSRKTSCPVCKSSITT